MPKNKDGPRIPRPVGYVLVDWVVLPTDPLMQRSELPGVLDHALESSKKLLWRVHGAIFDGSSGCFDLVHPDLWHRLDPRQMASMLGNFHAVPGGGAPHGCNWGFLGKRACGACFLKPPWRNETTGAWRVADVADVSHSNANSGRGMPDGVTAIGWIR